MSVEEASRSVERVARKWDELHHAYPSTRKGRQELALEMFRQLSIEDGHMEFEAEIIAEEAVRQGREHGMW